MKHKSGTGTAAIALRVYQLEEMLNFNVPQEEREQAQLEETVDALRAEVSALTERVEKWRGIHEDGDAESNESNGSNRNASLCSPPHSAGIHASAAPTGLSKVPALPASIVASDSGAQPHDMDDGRQSTAQRHTPRFSPPSSPYCHGRDMRPPTSDRYQRGKSDSSACGRMNKHSQRLASPGMNSHTVISTVWWPLDFGRWGYWLAGDATTTRSHLRDESTLHFSPDSSECETKGSDELPGERGARNKRTAQRSWAPASQAHGSSEIMIDLGPSLLEACADENDRVPTRASDKDCERSEGAEIVWADLDTAIDILTTWENEAEDGRHGERKDKEGSERI